MCTTACLWWRNRKKEKKEKNESRVTCSCCIPHPKIKHTDDATVCRRASSNPGQPTKPVPPCAGTRQIRRRRRERRRHFGGNLKGIHCIQKECLCTYFSKDSGCTLTANFAKTFSLFVVTSLCNQSMTTASALVV